MGAIAYQITSLAIVYSTVYSDADQSKHQSSASLAFVRGIHRGPVNSPYKWPVTRKMFPFDDVIMRDTYTALLADPTGTTDTEDGACADTRDTRLGIFAGLLKDMKSLLRYQDLGFSQVPFLSMLDLQGISLSCSSSNDSEMMIRSNAHRSCQGDRSCTKLLRDGFQNCDEQWGARAKALVNSYFHTELFTATNTHSSYFIFLHAQYEIHQSLLDDNSSLRRGHQITRPRLDASPDWLRPWTVSCSQRGTFHDDVIKWKHFPRNWPFVLGIHRSPVNSLHKGQWRGALMFSLICIWTNDWVNNREAGDLRRYRAHFDVIVMSRSCRTINVTSGVSRPSMKPNRMSSMHICCKKFSATLSRTFITWSGNLRSNGRRWYSPPIQ